MLVCSLAIVFVAGACGRPGPSPSEAEGVVNAGRALFTSEGCVRCHGDQGQGIIGPRLNEGSVLETFPSCSDQLRWVSLGSARWSRDIGPTYGAPAKPVRGGMPSFGSRLDPEQIVEVVTFTRVTFGQADPVESLRDCTG